MHEVLLYGLIIMRCVLAKRFVLPAVDHDAGSVQAECPKRKPTPLSPVDPVESSPYSVVQTSEDEKKVLEELFVPLVVGEFGTGADVNDDRKPYNNLQFLNAWKVLDSPEMSAYLKYKQQIHAKRSQTQAAKKIVDIEMAQANGETAQAKRIAEAAALKAAQEDSLGDELWVDTCRNDVQQMARDHGMTEDNEYLFMKGSRSDRLMHHMCHPRVWSDMNLNLDAANYGFGVYLTDASDKIDQYTGEAGLGFQELQKLLGSEHADLQKLQEQLQDSTPDDIFLAEVHRTYMGKHVEVQIDYLSCLTAGVAHEEREIMWYYRDPNTRNFSQRDVVIHDDPNIRKQFDRMPPFEADSWDSIKVMSTTFNPEYSENIRPRASLSPSRHNEYIVPRQDQTGIQYIVAYARKWDKEHPAEPRACASRTREPIPRAPTRPRPPCWPCSDGWEYHGKLGRLQPGEEDQSPTCAKKK